jgi:hypothetical protein
LHYASRVANSENSQNSVNSGSDKSTRICTGTPFQLGNAPQNPSLPVSGSPIQLLKHKPDTLNTLKASAKNTIFKP